MRDKRKWLKRFGLGLPAVCLLLLGFLFLFGKKGISAVGIWQGADAVSAEKKKIALTFDDGPHPVYTPLLLEGLKKREVKATFFLLGSAVEEYPEIAKEIAEEGHLIGNHTYHHVSLENADESLIETEVVSANELIESIVGEYPQFIRPPFGQCTDLIEGQTGMLCVLWTIDPLDWCTPDAAAVVERVVPKAEENAVILLHDQYKTSVMAALTIIDELQKEGYEFVTVDEILLD